ncbi:MAG: GNAT family N-acetyltransferase [Cyclobacteriaceae bacterium]
MAIVKAVTWNQSNKEAYDQLLDLSAKHSIQQRSEWLDAFVVEYLENGPTLVLEVYDGNEMIGSLPLEVKEVQGTRFFKSRQLHGLGSGPADFMYIAAMPGKEEVVAISLVEWLINENNEWEELYLHFLAHDCKTVNHLVTTLRASGFAPEVDDSRQYYVLDTTGSWEEYYTPEFNKKIRDIRGRLNRVERNNISISYEEVTENIADYLPGFIEHFNQRRSDKDEASSFEDERKIRLIKSILPAYEKKGWVRMLLLKDNEDNIWAYQLDLVHNNIWYHYSPTFNKEYAWYSPSKLLLYHTLQKCFREEGLHQLNFMRGESNYKTQFTEVTRNYLHIHMENPKSVRRRAHKAATKLVALRDKFLK